MFFLSFFAAGSKIVWRFPQKQRPRCKNKNLIHVTYEFSTKVGAMRLRPNKISAKHRETENFNNKAEQQSESSRRADDDKTRRLRNEIAIS